MPVAEPEKALHPVRNQIGAFSDLLDTRPKEVSDGCIGWDGGIKQLQPSLLRVHLPLLVAGQCTDGGVALPGASNTRQTRQALAAGASASAIAFSFPHRGTVP